MLTLLALLIPLCTLFFLCVVGNFVLSNSYMHQWMQNAEARILKYIPTSKKYNRPGGVDKNGMGLTHACTHGSWK
jgi:hypothetical protein